MTPEAQQQQEEQKQQQEERRQTMVVQVLQPQARERCKRHLFALRSTKNTRNFKSPKVLLRQSHGGFINLVKDHASPTTRDSVWCAVARIALVKPEKARGVENLVLQMAQQGQITEKVHCLSPAYWHRYTQYRRDFFIVCA